MISYAQNREDVLLARLFKGRREGFYIDVGANHPTHCSVTRHFYDLGWRGINVEPAVDLHALLQRERPRDVNLNLGISDEEGTLTFYESPGRTSGLSTFSAEEAAAHRQAGIEFLERPVTVCTLRQICEEHVSGPIDFLSIDVEGHERQVLLGGDFRRFRPRVLLLESVRPNSQIPSHERWEDLLLGADYLFGAFDGVNRYYVRREDAALLPLLAAPVSVFDDFQPYEHLAAMSLLREELGAVRAELSSTREALDRAQTELAAVQGREDGLERELGEGAVRAARGLVRLHRRFPRLTSAAGRLLRAVTR